MEMMEQTDPRTGNQMRDYGGAKLKPVQSWVYFDRSILTNHNVIVFS